MSKRIEPLGLRARNIRGLVLILILGLSAVSMVGCMQLETRVLLNEDGSATLTERVQFSRRLLERSDEQGGKFDVASLLREEAAQERVKHLGQGARLVSHKVGSGEKGSRETVTVFHIPDVNNLRYVNPFVRQPEYGKNTVVGFEVDVVKKASYLGDRPGELRLRIMPLSAMEGGVRTVDEQVKKHPRPAPATLQPLRRLQPIVRDLVRGLKVKFTVETYSPIRCSQAMRGFELEGSIKEVDLIDISDKNLDRRGVNFFSNEEAVLDFMRWWLDSSTMRAELKNANVNKTLPILQLRSGAIWFKPSQTLYDRYVKDVKMDFGVEGGGIRTVSFKDVGYQAEAPKQTSPQQQGKQE